MGMYLSYAISPTFQDYTFGMKLHYVFTVHVQLTLSKKMQA